MPPPRGAGSTFERAAAATAPPVLASAVEGTLAWAPTTGIQGMAASALVATQDVSGVTPPTPPAPPPPSTPPTATSRPPLANDPPAADVAPASGGLCGIAAHRSTGDGVIVALVTLALALAPRLRRRSSRG